jgi:putative membrane protein
MNWLIKEWKKSRKIEKVFILLLACFYLFGAIGMNHPFTKTRFESLSCFPLAYSFFMLITFHPVKNSKFWAAIFLAFTLGMVIEIAGVKTGKIFGSYVYTSVLGWSIFSVPIVIGMNWASLAYSCNCLSKQLFKHHPLWATIAAAAMMVGFDILIEPLAIRHQFWIWLEDGQPPFQNYAAWFAVGLFMSWTFQRWLPNQLTLSTVLFLLFLGLFLTADALIGILFQ